MANQASGKRLTAVLWFVAAALAFIAVGIRWSDGERDWSVAAGGVFCLAMGIGAWAGRQRTE